MTANNDLPAGSQFLLTRQAGRDAIAPTNSQRLFLHLRCKEESDVYLSNPYFALRVINVS